MGAAMTVRSRRTALLLRVTAITTAFAAALACSRCAVHRFSDRIVGKAPAPRGPAVDLEPSQPVLAPRGGPAHRLLLDADAMARLADCARRKTDAWKIVVARADEALAAPVASGYQGWDWADALADTSLVWLATGDARYADGALRYYRALLDDRLVVGDGKGGDDVITHDSGYGIRTFGAYTALGYDWLRDAPGMDAQLRARALERLDHWLAWYAAKGYLRDKPTANYYWGYLTALSFAGLAAAGDSPSADAWLARSRDALAQSVLPTFRDQLAGGGWPEGWQYGENTAVEVALVARAFRTGAGVDVAGKMPWLSQVVRYHVHALLPDERSVYDGGTWGEHPAKPSAAGLAAVVVALDGVDDASAAQGRWLMAHALPPLVREQAWVRLLADRPGAAERPPRDHEPTSLHVAGAGLTFVRSDWSPAAVWASFQAGPRLAEDHQDADQGHFELFRGSDGLLVDGGDSEGSATVNHNTLLVDDGGRVLDYPPNQGVWGAKVRTTRFADDGVAVVAVGDLADAWAPHCSEDGCTKRAVQGLVRTFVFVRPSLLVVDDRVVVDRPDVGVVWAAHVTTQPRTQGSLTSAVVGASRVDVRTLEPANAQPAALREPTPSGEGSHRADHPWGPMWRVEIPSPTGARERGFLQFITADRADAAPPVAEAVTGEGARGGIGTVAGRRTAVLFADPQNGGTATLAGGADVVVVAGLEPGTRYEVSVRSRAPCVVAIAPSAAPSAQAATAGGYVRMRAADCEGQ
jgi:hypothetical protein